MGRCRDLAGGVRGTRERRQRRREWNRKPHSTHFFSSFSMLFYFSIMILFYFIAIHFCNPAQPSILEAAIKWFSTFTHLDFFFFPLQCAGGLPSSCTLSAVFDSSFAYPGAGHSFGWSFNVQQIDPTGLVRLLGSPHLSCTYGTQSSWWMDPTHWKPLNFSEERVDIGSGANLVLQ